MTPKISLQVLCCTIYVLHFLSELILVKIYFSKIQKNISSTETQNAMSF